MLRFHARPAPQRSSAGRPVLGSRKTPPKPRAAAAIRSPTGSAGSRSERRPESPCPKRRIGQTAASATAHAPVWINVRAGSARHAAAVDVVAGRARDRLPGEGRPGVPHSLHLGGRRRRGRSGQQHQERGPRLHRVKVAATRRERRKYRHQTRAPTAWPAWRTCTVVLTGSRATGPAATRRMGFLLYFDFPPRRFTGGELLLYDLDPDTLWPVPRFTNLPPETNSLVVLPANCWHEVLPVRCPGDDWTAGRFTYSGWIHDAGLMEDDDGAM